MVERVTGRVARASGGAAARGRAVVLLLAAAVCAAAMAPVHGAVAADESIATAGAAPVPPAAQDDADERDDAVQVEELPGAVHLLRSGRDGNVLAVRGERGVLLVDAGSAARADALVAAVRALHDPDALPVRHVVCTHYHEDHVGASATLAAAGAEIIAHERTRHDLSVASEVPEFGWRVEAVPPEARPTLTVRNGLVLHLGNQDVHVIHVPAAHTGGDLVVHLPDADVVHTGDVVEVGEYPFLDIWHGGTLDGLVEAVDVVLSLSSLRTRIVPGHGAVIGRDDVVAYRAMLAALRPRVAAAVQAGETLEELLATEPTAPFDGRFGTRGAGERLVTIAYLERTRER